MLDKIKYKKLIYRPIVNNHFITSVDKNINEARKKVYEIIEKIHIPKMFYRTDIGLVFDKTERKKLKQWKWI